MPCREIPAVRIRPFQSHLRVSPMASGATCTIWKERQSCVTPRAMPVASDPRNLLCSAPSLTSFLLAETCQLYIIPLGGSHNVIGKGPTFPFLDLSQEIQNLEMWELLFWKGALSCHFYEVSKTHFSMSKSPGMCIPLVL